MSEKIVLVRWKTRGAFILNGISYPRAKGDVDPMPLGQAKALAISKVVEITGEQLETLIPEVSEDAYGSFS